MWSQGGPHRLVDNAEGSQSLVIEEEDVLKAVAPIQAERRQTYTAVWGNWNTGRIIEHCQGGWVDVKGQQPEWCQIAIGPEEKKERDDADKQAKVALGNASYGQQLAYDVHRESYENGLDTDMAELDEAEEKLEDTQKLLDPLLEDALDHNQAMWEHSQGGPEPRKRQKFDDALISHHRKVARQCRKVKDHHQERIINREGSLDLERFGAEARMCRGGQPMSADPSENNGYSGIITRLNGHPNRYKCPAYPIQPHYAFEWADMDVPPVPMFINTVYANARHRAGFGNTLPQGVTGYILSKKAYGVQNGQFVLRFDQAGIAKDNNL